MAFNCTGCLVHTLGTDLLELGAVACGLSLTRVTTNSTFFNLKKGHHAIICNCIFSVQHKVYHTGWHKRIPWIEKPVIYDIRAPQSIESTHYIARDQDKVKSSVQILSRPVPEKLARIYGGLVLSKELKGAITPRAANFNIVVDGVSITGMNFGNFSKANDRSNAIIVQEVDKSKIFSS